MTRRHIRKALRLAGVKASDVSITQNRHIHLLLNGKRITTACSPRNEYVTALNLARDLRAAMANQENME